jgi:hypothetical protein
MGQTFMTFDKACTTPDSCSFGLHQVNCCGSDAAIGFNHAQLANFTTAEASWDKTCTACQCQAGDTLAEDGKTCGKGAITVSCDNGMCTTHCR